MMAATMQPVEKRRRWQRAGTWLVIAGAVLALVGSTFFGFQAGQRGRQVEAVRGEKATVQTQAEVAEQQKNDLADATGPICLRPSSDAQLQELCRTAAMVKDTPPVLSLLPEQVDYARVRSIVANALATDPRLQADALLILVRQVYAVNKPADGKTPTDEELLTLIRRVVGENPPKDGSPGADGRDGVDGQSGRDGQDGNDGQDGAPGPACPAGFHQEQTTASDGRPMIACFQDGSEPTTTAPAPLLGRR